MTRPGRTRWLLVLAVSAVLLAGCSVVEDAAQNQVDNATERAGEAVQNEVQEQAQSALDGVLAEVDSPCSELLAGTESERTAVLSSVLQAFWLAELSTDQPPQEVVANWTAAVVGSCQASPESRVADVARTTYDGGGFSPPQE